MKNNNIKTVDFGIAFKINDQIYVHKNLKKYPKLYKALIKHEKEHSDNFNLRDIWLDLKGKHLGKVKKQYYKFLLREKKAWWARSVVALIERAAENEYNKRKVKRSWKKEINLKETISDATQSFPADKIPQKNEDKRQQRSRETRL